MSVSSVSTEEMGEQRLFTQRVRAVTHVFDHRPLAYTHSYGCQQNVSDGEKINGMLAEMGFGFTDSPEHADLVLYNTCAVRENAENRVFGNVGALKALKQKNPDMVIAVCGCMVQQEHIAERMKKRFPYVDLIFGTHVLHRFPELLYTIYEKRRRTVCIPDCDGVVAEGLPVRRDSRFKASVPVMYGSALRIEGVSELLEVIGKYTKPPAYKDTFGARVYKTMTDKTGEKLSFIKVTGGSLNVRDNVSVKSPAISGRSHQVTNENGKMPGVSDGSDVRKTAKINQIRLYSGNRFQTIDTAGAGMVCAVTGLGSVIPGTALGNEDPAADLSSEPFMIYSVIIPDGKDPHAVMGDMQTLSSEDPALCAEWSGDGSEILIRIMGEVQLQILQQIIRDRFGYEVGFGQGRVLYLETITDTYEGVGHFEPLRHYAEVHLIISPGERGSGIVITSDVAEDELALNWQRLIWTHLEEKEHTGVLTGAPLTDVHISIAAGKAHLKHTMGGDFREATYRAVRHAMMQAKRDGNMLLLEPWCEYEIELPAKDLGRAVTDIKQMGGIQSDLEQGEATAVIRGRVPSAKIEPYRQVLTGYTSGEGKLHVTQCGYDAACDANTVIEETGYDAEHDTANPADSVFVSHTGSDIVKWDEVFEHMHLPVVLKTETRGGDQYITDPHDNNEITGANAAEKIDPREAARRRMAAEKDLQRIFEMTYGQAKPKRYIESKTVTAGEDDLSEEEAAGSHSCGSPRDSYPSATSSAIISVNPAANIKTPMFECSPSDISGISSSTTT